MNTTLILAVIATAVITATVSVSITTHNAEALNTPLLDCMKNALETYNNGTTSALSDTFGKYADPTATLTNYLLGAILEESIATVTITDAGNILNQQIEICKAIYQ